MNVDHREDMCVALSLSSLLSWHYCKKADVDPLTLSSLELPSAKMIYIAAKSRESKMTESKINGITCYDALLFGKEYGYCSNEEYLAHGEDDEDCDNSASELRPISGKFLIKNFERIKSTEEVKLAVTKSGPCLLVLPCYNDSCKFWKPSRDQLLQVYLRQTLSDEGKIIPDLNLVPDLEEKLNDINIVNEVHVVNHCLLLTGFTSTQFVLTNCWGSDWCTAGTCKIDIEDFNLCAIEAWSISV